MSTTLQESNMLLRIHEGGNSYGIYCPRNMPAHHSNKVQGQFIGQRVLFFWLIIILRLQRNGINSLDIKRCLENDCRTIFPALRWQSLPSPLTAFLGVQASFRTAVLFRRDGWCLSKNLWKQRPQLTWALPAKQWLIIFYRQCQLPGENEAKSSYRLFVGTIRFLVTSSYKIPSSHCRSIVTWISEHFTSQKTKHVAKNKA